ncbi:MAG: hypothetical protein WC495_06640 [Patescibacteria group bacterium]|jgi:hypothetical protein
MDTNPIAPVPQKKKNKIHIVIMLLLAVVTAGLGYFYQREAYLGSIICITLPYGLPLKIQDRAMEKFEDTDLRTGNLRQYDCGTEIESEETSAINWINWILNFIFFAVLFGLVGYLVMLTRWYWYALLPVVYLIAVYISKVIESSQHLVTP